MNFTEASLLKKFQELNNTQQSVQTLSLWLIHYRKHSNTIVRTWLKELSISAKCDRKLTFIYLANDILQNSRKKGTEFLKEFLTVLPEAVENAASFADKKMRFTLERILNIWKDRKIYPDENIENLKSILHKTKFIGDSPDDPVDKSKELSKSKITITKIPRSTDSPNKTKPSEMENRKRKVGETKHDMSGEPISKQNSLVKNSLREEVLKELANSTSIQIPEPAELVGMLQELEKSASSDAVVREKIAELPNKVVDLNAVKNLKDKKEALELLTPVSDASTLLDNYNTRLQQELTSRKQTALLLAAFIRQQRTECDNDQKLIDEWQRKLKQVKSVKTELQIHLESLPDLSSIEEAATLTPLPSAGDLFSS